MTLSTGDGVEVRAKGHKVMSTWAMATAPQPDRCFGASDTGLPSIGAVPGAKGCFAVLGYGGNGITFSTVAAQLIQRAVVGLRDPDQDLFAFPG